MALSSHFVLGDFLVDAHFPELADKLEPTARVLENLTCLAALLDRVCGQFPPGVEILSGFRDVPLNEACRKAGLPASIDSEHLYGCAADIRPLAGKFDPEVVYEWLEQNSHTLGVHEAVFYPLKGFVHVGIANPEHVTPKRILMRT